MPGPGSCQICAHERRVEIDVALVGGVSRSVLARRFSVSPYSLKRHATNHLTGVQRAAVALALKPEAVDIEQLSRSEGSSLLANLVAGRARLLSIAEAALANGEHAAAVRAESAIQDNLALVARLLGQIV